LALHRSRQSFIKQRTAQANQIRGLLAEFGIVVPRGIHSTTWRTCSMSSLHSTSRLSSAIGKMLSASVSARSLVLALLPPAR
jgi:transposase